MAALLLGLLQAEAPAPEYDVKAAFLLNFAKYVEWPPACFEGPEAPIAVGILGPDPFGDALETAFRGRRVRGRPLKIRRFARPGDVQGVHVLFVPRAETARLPEVAERAGRAHVLLVGESEGFCRAGGALSVLIEAGKPRIEANPDAAARADLTIDARLLKVARIVRERP